MIKAKICSQNILSKVYYNIILYPDLYHPQMFANTRGWDHPGLCKARSGHQFPIQPARVYPRMISEVHPVLFEIAGWSLDRHSDIRNPTNRLSSVKVVQ